MFDVVDDEYDIGGDVVFEVLLPPKTGDDRLTRTLVRTVHLP